MSYSRWSNSNWYSFWSSLSPTKDKNDQLLSLWYVGNDNTPNFSYKLLKNMDPITQLQGYYKSQLSLDDIEEARKIIEMFIDDVDEDYSNEEKDD